MAQAEVTMVLTPIATGVPINLVQATDTASCFVRTKALDLGKVEWSKLIDQIVSHVSNRTSQTNLVLRVYTSDDEDGPFTLQDTISVAQEDPANVDPPAFKYVKLEYADLAIQDRWRLHGIEIWGTLAGQEY